MFCEESNRSFDIDVFNTVLEACTEYVVGYIVLVSVVVLGKMWWDMWAFCERSREEI